MGRGTTCVSLINIYGLIHNSFVKECRLLGCFMFRNGLVRQGINQEAAIKQLKEAIASFLGVYKIEPNIYRASLTIEELHEFLKVEHTELVQHGGNKPIIPNQRNPYAVFIFNF